MFTRIAIPLAAATLLVSGCGSGSPTSSTAPETTTEVATTTRTKTPEEAQYDRWKAAYAPYKSGGMKEREWKSAYQYQSGACDVLRNGGTEGSDVVPAKSPAQYLRDDWGVGDGRPGAKDKAEVLEKVVVPTLCPEQSLAVADALAGNYEEQLPISFGNGKFLVGTNIQPGTYTISGPVEDCYWERSDSQGNIIDNNFISIAPSVTVTIAASDGGFTSDRCGRWSLK